MRMTRENVDKIHLEDKDKRLLLSIISDINELNEMTGKDFFLDWQDFHDEYSPERTDPCPDYYGYFSVRESSYFSTIGEKCLTVSELDSTVLVLVDTFATMGYNYYYGIGKGWYRLVREVMLAIDKYNFDHPDGGQVHIRYVKEKWGMLRIEVDSCPPEIGDLIQDVEERSSSICENCGKEAETFEIHGWLHTLCDECYKNLAGGEVDNFREIMRKSLRQQEAIIKSRQEYNMKILELLKEEVLSYPEIRLCQLLSIFKIGDIDKFNEESVKTYNDIVKLRKERKN